MTYRDDDVSLLHIRDHAEKIVLLLEDLDRGNRLDDWVTQLALRQLFEILGEAANRVSADTRTQYPEIPWRDMIDTRNRLIHGYETVDMSILWKTARNRIPMLLDRLDKVIEQRSQTESSDE